MTLQSYVRVWVLAAVAIVAVALIFARGPGAASAQVDLADVGQQFFDAMNAGDVDAALGFFTEDASFQGTLGCVTPCVGMKAIRAEFESFVADNIRFTVIRVIEASGNTLIRRFEATSDSIRAAGVDRILATGTAEFEGDRISSVVIVVDTTDEQTAQFLASFAGMGPPAAGTGELLGEGGSDLAIWWYVLAAGGGLLTITGIALRKRSQRS